MVCVSCGSMRSQSSAKKLYRLDMLEILLSNGFTYGGKCNCSTPMDYYSKAGIANKRIKVSNSGYWIQVKQNLFTWTNIDYGNASTLQEKINKYFI